MTSHQNGISEVFPQTSFPGESSGGIARCRLLSQDSVFPPGVGGTPYDGLYGELPPEWGIFFRLLQVHERVGISLLEVYKGYGNVSFESVKGPQRVNR